MKVFKILGFSVLFLGAMISFSSCEKDPCETVVCENGGTCEEGICACLTGYSGIDCGTHCGDALIGTWNVTGGQTGGCDITKYIFAPGATKSEMLVTITVIDGTMANVTGTLSVDCSTMMYEISGGAIGTITFNGNTFTDVLGTECIFNARKQ